MTEPDLWTALMRAPPTLLTFCRSLLDERDQLRRRVEELEAEADRMLGNWTNVKARDRLRAVLDRRPDFDRPE